MTELPPKPEREQKQVDDNDRKFVLTPVEDGEFNPVYEKAYDMTTWWLIAEDNREKKLVHKVFHSGVEEYWLITKKTDGKNRKSDKVLLYTDADTDAEVDADALKGIMELVGNRDDSSRKARYELSYVQGDIKYNLKYDVFIDSYLRVLEVDSVSKRAEERDAFDPRAFEGLFQHSFALEEVTGQAAYTGHNVIETAKLDEYRLA